MARLTPTFLRQRRFRTRLVLMLGGFVALAGILFVYDVNRTATAFLVEARTAGLQSAARSLAQSLANNMAEREREIYGLSRSAVLMQADLSDRAIRSELERRTNFAGDYVWIGLADMQGTVRAATGGLLEGVSVKNRTWYENGLAGEAVGDVHDALLLEKLIQNRLADQPVRFIDFIAPVHDMQGRLRGVLGAHTYLDWVSGAIESAQPPEAAASGIDTLLVDRRGLVIYPRAMLNEAVPAKLMESDQAIRMVWSDGIEYLMAGAPVRSRVVDPLGWRVVVRQPVAAARKPVADLHRQMAWLGLVLGMVFVVLAFRFAASLSRPLEQLASTASDIAQGKEAGEFSHAGDSYEIVKLTEALRVMQQTLEIRRRKLEELNADLEHQVQQRTEQLQEANRQLAHEARSDALTGLGNRRLAAEQLREEFFRMQRSGGGYSVLSLDIDHFKSINDELGHPEGDEVLRKVAAVLRVSARITDYVYRYGGEEFLIILPDTVLERAALVAEKLRSTIEASACLPERPVTVSIGVAHALGDDPDELAVVRRADQALYQAKSDGRNRVKSPPA